MAWHVRGVVLPDDVVRDVWVVGDRVTFEPVRAAVLVAPGVSCCPAWSTRTATRASVRRGGRSPRLAEAKRLAALRSRHRGADDPRRRFACPDTGVRQHGPACRD